MRKLSSYLILLAVLVVLSACVTNVSTPEPIHAEATLVPEIVPTFTPKPIPTLMPTQNMSEISIQKAIDFLSNQLGLPADQIRVISTEQVQWINACLGFQSPDEVCAEVLTDGYLVMLAAGEKTYELHMGLDGSNIRMKSGPTKDVPREVDRARQMAAKDLNLEPDEITLVSITEKNWPDACMGRSEPELMCAQVITPGYEIAFEVFGKQIVYAVSSRNNAAFLISNPFFHSGMRDVLIVLDQKTPTCQTAMFSDAEVTAGNCGADLVSYPFVDRDYWRQINWLAARYAPFEMQTDEGAIRFASRGAQIASLAEQRSIYEWAKIALMTSIQQVSGPDAGLVTVIRQTGGIAGICNQTTLHLDGWAYQADCSQAELSYQPYRMTSTELASLYEIFDQFAAVEITKTIPESAPDAFNYEIKFYGRGTGAMAANDLDRLIQLIR